MLSKHVTIDYEFLCLTNIELNCKTIPLEYNHWGWWNKLQLYKIPGPVFYMDIDTIITDNIDDILNELSGREFSMYLKPIDLKQYNKEIETPDKIYKRRWTEHLKSALMYWSGDVSFLWNHFYNLRFFDILDRYSNRRTPNWDKVNDDGELTPGHVWPEMRGDQAAVSFIMLNNYKNIFTPLARKAPSPDPEYFNFPIGSFKRDVLPLTYENVDISEILSKFKIVQFHGTPRPYEQDIIPY
jgi:hypothetical protein